MADGDKPGPGGWNRIHLIVDDLEAEVARLRGAGVVVPQRGREGRAASRSSLLDPSGNVIELFQPAGDQGRHPEPGSSPVRVPTDVSEASA